MKPWLHKTEVIIDKTIPFLLILLVFLIVGEIFFHHQLEPFHLQIEILDGIIILIFAVDLSFKYNRMRNIPKFLKKYWLEIIAIFPFFLIFRVFESIADFFGVIRETLIPGQKVLHEALEVEARGTKIAKTISKEARVLEAIEKEGARLAREAEAIGKVSRSSRFVRVARPLARTPRLFMAKSPTVKREVKRDVRKIKKETKKVEKEVLKEERWVVKKLRKLIGAFTFYEKPSGKHHPRESKKDMSK